MADYDILVTDLSVIVTADPERSSSENPLGRVESGVIGVKDGRLAYVGPASGLPRDAQAAETFSARNAVAFPGLIDGHTHPVFGGSREDEYARRLSGVPYMRIAAEGGGINRTVRDTRLATEDELFGRSRRWLDEMLRQGVTTLEAKSGYGLDMQTELKMLSVIGRLDREHAMDVVPTFLGAHEFPPEYRERREAYVNLVIGEMLPAVEAQGIARFCDVFCEQGVFTIGQTSRILNAAMDRGLTPRFHADEFVESGGALLACEIGAVAADHLTAVGKNAIAAMEQSDVIACLLPSTSYYLGHGHYAPARAFLEKGVRVALASDFNPGSSVGCNLPLTVNTACTQMKMTFAEALLAVTRHAAESLLLGDRLGQLRQGYQADILLLDIPRPEYFVYHFGRNHTWKVLKKGRIAYESPFEPVFLS